MSFGCAELPRLRRAHVRAAAAALLAVLAWPAALRAQSGFNLRDREAVASRMFEPPVIDGSLDEAAWLQTVPTSDFTQSRPYPNTEATHRTVLRIGYDDQNLYVGAILFDPAPDSILQQLSVRDRVENSDEFGIWFSPYNDGINAVAFVTTPQGLLADFLLTAGGDDASWNGVWEVASRIHDGGWSTEIRIPWSQFRMPSLPAGAEQTWGMNAWRIVRRSREETVWNALDPTQQGMVNQGGVLRGISGVDTPPRVAVFPYLSAYAQNAPTLTGGSEWALPINGGLDAKVGLGDAFTVDMTLVPDFGQVVADNLVLNLSPYEVRFDENRPFFQEGTDLFNKGGWFYSRRVGSEGTLLNATKLSGRTSGSTGLGVFQALARDTALAEGLTSYTVAVVDQNLPNNGYVTALSTATVREGTRRDAYVQGTQFNLRNRANSLALGGSAAVNRMAQGDTAAHREGHTWSVTAAKTSGQFRWNLAHYEESEFYDPNDLGYLAAPNEVVTYGGLEYGIYEPFGAFNRMWWSLNSEHAQLFAPRAFSNWRIESEWAAVTRTFWFNKVGADWQPRQGQDYFASRLDGIPWTTPSAWSVEAVTSTDYRKAVALDGFAKRVFRPAHPEWRERYLRLAPRFRFSDAWSAEYVWSLQARSDERGWANLVEDDIWGAPRSLFGRRENTSQTHVLTMSFIFDPRSSLSARVRHYWSVVDYHAFFELNADGSLQTTAWADTFFDAETGTSVEDVNYNAWSVDLVYSWIFSPGSEWTVVWKNTLNSSGNTLPTSYGENWDLMLEEGFSNSLSMRILYYLDYSMIDARNRRH